MTNDVIAALEIGTSMIRSVVCEIRDDDSISVLALSEVKSNGIRKGEIFDRNEVIDSVRHALKELELNYRKNINAIIISLSGGNTECYFSDAVSRIADPNENIPQEILQDDIVDLSNIAKRVALPSSRIKLHSFNQYFKVDDIDNVVNPLGMTCESLSLQVLTVHGKQSIVENFQKLVADVPIDCIEAIYSGLSSALAVTTEAMRKTGVVVIDIGGGTTDYCIYHDNILKLCGTFTVGGDHITNDIAAGLQIPVENAEEVKIREGNALLNLMERDRNISLPSTNNGFSGKIIRAITLNTIIEARMKEIFQLVKSDIDHKLPSLPLSGGILITGGGSYLNGARDLSQKIFNLPSMIGKPRDTQGLPSVNDGPRFSALIGAIRYFKNHEKKMTKSSNLKKILNLFWGK